MNTDEKQFSVNRVASRNQIPVGHQIHSGSHFWPAKVLIQTSWFAGVLFLTSLCALGQDAPTITTQPTNQTVIAGSNATFTVTATGTAPLRYQWWFSGLLLNGATNLSLTLTNAQPTNAGNYLVVVTNSAGVATSSVANLTVLPVISVGGRIQGTVVWSQTNAIYRLINNLEVPFGTALSIAPGVVVDGNGSNMWVGGSFNALGTKVARIRFSNLYLKPGKPSGDSQSTQTYAMRIAFSDFAGGSLHGPTGDGHGSLTLTDSVLTNVPFMYLWYPVTNCFIERNIFQKFGGISVGHELAVKVYVRNNLFYEPTLTDGRYYAVENWVATSTSQTIVEFNSFLATNRTAVSVIGGWGATELIATNNYWSTTNLAVIQNMIHDRADDTNCYSYIPYLPILTNHHSETPGIDRPPIIVAYPTNRVATAGTTSSFSVTAKGSEPFHYQWRQNGQEIHGETNATLTLTNLLPVNSGAYDVVITNAFGQSASPPAELVVSQPDGTPLIAVNEQSGPSFSFTNIAAVEIEILTAFSGGTIFYTRDGSRPDFGSAVYSGPFLLTRSAAIRAVAYDTNFNVIDGNPVSITLALTPPTATVNGQAGDSFSFTNQQSVQLRLASALPNAQIYYKLDGTTPSLASSRYTSPLVISQSVVLRAMAYTPELGSSIGNPVPINLWWTYPLTATTAGGGTVGLNPPGGSYRNDAVVQVTANPAPGWTFLQWTGDASGTNPVVNVTMERAKGVNAVFGTGIGKSVVGQGAMQFNPSLALYSYGSTIQAVAVPQPGSFFALWGGSASGNANPLPFTVTNSGSTISALFSTLASNRVALTVIPNGKGSVAVAPRTSSFTNGQVVTVTAIPDTGQSFHLWSGDAAGKTNPLVLRLSNSAVITANFTGGDYPFTLSSAQLLASGSFRMMVSGEPERSVTLEVSTNLLQWATRAVISNRNGSVEFIDNSATNFHRRFYRGVQ